MFIHHVLLYPRTVSSFYPYDNLVKGILLFYQSYWWENWKMMKQNWKKIEIKWIFKMFYFIIFINNFYFYVWVFWLQACLCTMFVCGTRGFRTAHGIPCNWRLWALCVCWELNPPSRALNLWDVALALRWLFWGHTSNTHFEAHPQSHFGFPM